MARSSILSATLGSFVIFQSTIHEYTHLPSPDTVSYRVCRWLDRALCAILFSLLTPEFVFLSNLLSSPWHCFAVGAKRAFSLHLEAVSLIMFDNWQNILTCHHPELSLTGFAVGSIEHSLRNLMQLRKFPISNPRIYSLAIARHCLWRGLPLAGSSILPATLFSFVTSESDVRHMLSCRRADTVSDRVCRWREGAFYLHRWAVSLLAFDIWRIYSLSITRHCLWQGLPLARWSILSTTWCSFVNFRLAIREHTH